MAAVVAIDLWIVGSTRARSLSPADAPQAEAAIVLGASVLRDGRPSEMLADRLRVAAALFHDGKVPRVLVSGDRDPAREYDEVGPMVAALRAAGIPADAILEDVHGYRTLDSMCRAKTVFDLHSALVVTNGFHVPRAVYLGEHFGLDVHGVVADLGVTRPLATRVRHVGREVLARVLAWFDCHLLGTQPAVDGPRRD